MKTKYRSNVVVSARSRIVYVSELKELFFGAKLLEQSCKELLIHNPQIHTREFRKFFVSHKTNTKKSTFAFVAPT